MYLSPHFVTESIKNNWPIYDNGQTEYYFASYPYSSNMYLFKKIFPITNNIESNFKNYVNLINKKVEEKKFSLIIISEEHYSLINKELLDKNYKVIKKAYLPINLGKINFYKPKNKY